MQVLSEFLKKDMSRIRNKSAFLNGIIGRVQVSASLFLSSLELSDTKSL